MVGRVGLALIVGFGTAARAQPPLATCQARTGSSLPVAFCEEVQPGSLAAVRCRLDRLRAQIEDEDALGNYQAKLLGTLGRGIDRANEAATACGDTDARTGRRRMKQLQRHLTKVTHRLRGLSARHQLDPALRTGLVEVVESIKADVTVIRKQPCPA